MKGMRFGKALRGRGPRGRGSSAERVRQSRGDRRLNGGQGSGKKKKQT